MTQDLKVAAFHIGAHKTGTSVVQRYLDRHRAELDRSGLDLPSRAELGDLIGWGSNLIDHPERMVARMAEFSDDQRHHTFFGSIENLIGRPFVRSTQGRLYPNGPNNVKALARTLRRVRPRIVLSVRPQADFLESYYLQFVNEGGHEPFQEWLARVDFHRLSWVPLVEALHDWFGAPNVHVVDFRLIEQGQSSYVSRILRLVDPDFGGDVRFEKPINRSLSAKGLSLALAANPHLRDPAERHAMRRFLQQHFSNVHYPRACLLTPDQRSRLADLYSTEYDQVTGVTTSVHPGHAS